MGEDSAVYSFEDLVDGKKIVAELQDKMEVSLAEGHKFGRHVELLSYHSEVHSPQIFVEMGMPEKKPDCLMRGPCATVSFYPVIPEGEASTSCGEFVFQVDYSFRMSLKDGSQTFIEIAKKELILLLKCLPVGCYFNVYGFGSSYQMFFLKSGKYTQQTMEKAVKRVKLMCCNEGDSDILKTLKSIYRRPSIAGHPLKVLRSLKHSLQSVVEDVSLSWNLPLCVSANILSPETIVIFRGQRLILYAQLIGMIPAAEAIGEIFLRYTLLGQTFKQKLTFSLQPKPDANNSTIHHLAVKSLIQIKDFSPRKMPACVQSDLLNMSAETGVISSFTVFIGKNKELNQSVYGPLIHRLSPAMYYHTSSNSGDFCSTKNMNIYSLAKFPSED
ncbi:von Willebrand factor A domain-containing protein 5A [Sciurus carolinensis]|uniref:von Willebrand factor A domain-containing protein 5A n=1 Tax=Sciurus carolinensis TaxID=30640 RepID=A0AA41STM9_SCICA|nr:von Willebrand factor A domain-containing protein 5A [Sciurus carolinensis]